MPHPSASAFHQAHPSRSHFAQGVRLISLFAIFPAVIIGQIIIVIYFPPAIIKNIVYITQPNPVSTASPAKFSAALRQFHFHRGSSAPRMILISCADKSRSLNSFHLPSLFAFG
jgi:hypothetical protein